MRGTRGEKKREKTGGNGTNEIQGRKKINESKRDDENKYRKPKAEIILPGTHGNCSPPNGRPNQPASALGIRTVAMLIDAVDRDKAAFHALETASRRLIPSGSICPLPASPVTKEASARLSCHVCGVGAYRTVCA